MRRIVFPVLFLALMASTSGGQEQAPETQYQGDYLDAIAAFYKVPRGSVGQTAEEGISGQSLPVVFCIAGKAGVSRERIVEARKEGKSWLEIGADHDLTASDFYVSLTRKPVGDQYIKTYDKFEGLGRDEFAQVKLDDADIEHLVNLRFLYRHYNYSQYLIMVWSSEGKGFPEINHLLKTITDEMKQEKTKTGE